MKLKIYNSKENKKFLQMLFDQFGFITETKYFYMESGKEKIYMINTDITRINLDDYRIDTMGLYIGKYQSDGFRPSIEGSQIIGKNATKNVLEISLEQRHRWLKGEDIEVEHPEAIVLVKSETDFLGAGKVSKGILLTGIPKSRRLAVVNEELEF
jgi:NOL1/NOP2/fmu family ribosome biogenesis protein